ncbi:MAG: hypothetical protein H0U28_02930 [Nocardioidaceae bacterium]|nr:hypothetical protein [Nocardioidaceae bacterium]
MKVAKFGHVEHQPEQVQSEHLDDPGVDGAFDRSQMLEADRLSGVRNRCVIWSGRGSRRMGFSE